MSHTPEQPYRQVEITEPALDSAKKFWEKVCNRQVLLQLGLVAYDAFALNYLLPQLGKGKTAEPISLWGLVVLMRCTKLASELVHIMYIRQLVNQLILNSSAHSVDRIDNRAENSAKGVSNFHTIVLFLANLASVLLVAANCGDDKNIRSLLVVDAMLTISQLIAVVLQGRSMTKATRDLLAVTLTDTTGIRVGDEVATRNPDADEVLVVDTDQLKAKRG